MDNQHRKITGYRELSQAEIDGINAIKAEGIAILDVLTAVGNHIAAQRRMVATMTRTGEAATISGELAAILKIEPEAPVGSNGFYPLSYAECNVLRGRISVEQLRLDAAQPERWVAIARTHFQEGLMALTRAVAQPGFF